MCLKFVRCLENRSKFSWAKKWAMFLPVVFFCLMAHALDKNNILYIGDSHTAGDFGSSLESLISSENPDFKIVRKGIVGSRAPRWSDVEWPKLPHSDSQTVIVALGTNDLAVFCKSPLVAVTHAQALLAKLQSEQKCIWVGPPLLSASSVVNACGGEKGMAHFREIYKQGIESQGCHYVDSSKSLLYPNAGDGLHFSGVVAKRWAQFVYKEMADILKPAAKPAGSFSAKPASRVTP